MLGADFWEGIKGTLRLLIASTFDDLAGLVAEGDPVKLGTAAPEVVNDLVFSAGVATIPQVLDAYAASRAASKATGRFVPRIDTSGFGVSNSTAGWIKQPLFTSSGEIVPDDHLGKALDGVIVRARSAADDLVLDAPRQTVYQGVVMDKGEPRYYRVPNSDTCAFCLMLAGRGPVYASRQKAGDWGNRFHSKCDCDIEPLFPGGKMREDYRTWKAEGEEGYRLARNMPDDGFLRDLDATDNRDLREVLHNMRRTGFGK